MPPNSQEGVISLDVYDNPTTFFVDYYNRKGGVRTYSKGKWIDLNSQFGITAGYPLDLQIHTDKKQRIIISYIEEVANEQTKLVLKRFDKNDWQTLGEINLGHEPDYLYRKYAVTIDSNDNIYIAYRNLSLFYDNNPHKLAFVTVSIYSDTFREFKFIDRTTSLRHSMSAVKLNISSDSILNLIIQGQNSEGRRVLSHYSYNLKKETYPNHPTWGHRKEIASLPTPESESFWIATKDHSGGDNIPMTKAGEIFAVQWKVKNLGNSFYGSLALFKSQKSEWSKCGNTIEFGKVTPTPNMFNLLFDNKEIPYLELRYSASSYQESYRMIMKLEGNTWREYAKIQGGMYGHSFFNSLNQLVIVQRFTIRDVYNTLAYIPKYYVYDNNKWTEIWK